MARDLGESYKLHFGTTQTTTHFTTKHCATVVGLCSLPGWEGEGGRFAPWVTTNSTRCDVQRFMFQLFLLDAQNEIKYL